MLNFLYNIDEISDVSLFFFGKDEVLESEAILCLLHKVLNLTRAVAECFHQGFGIA